MMEVQIMEKCEKCGKVHDCSYGSGRFCCDICARTYSTDHVNRSKNKIVQCIDCGKDIEVSIHASPKQCKCNGCRKRPKGKINEKHKHCLNCKKEMSTKRMYCNTTCQNEYQYKQYIEKWKNDETEGKKGLGISTYIRKYLFEKYDNKCSKCGWNEINETTGNVPLEVEHIDGNSSNNKDENLTLLCPNCHSLTSTYKALNKGNGRHNRMERYKQGLSY
jgi:hypothetical protein